MSEDKKKKEEKEEEFPIEFDDKEWEEKLKKMIAFQEDQYEVMNKLYQYKSRAQIRTVSKDKLPMAGKYKQNEKIFMLGGLGSRGFCYGPILGDHVASIIDESISPLEKNIAESLTPRNFK